MIFVDLFYVKETPDIFTMRTKSTKNLTTDGIYPPFLWRTDFTDYIHHRERRGHREKFSHKKAQKEEKSDTD
jgi:hypothetical protein